MIALVCLHCNHSNLDDAKYCSKCGAGLLRRLCPSCHVANGGDSQFCQDCGFRLPAEAEAPTLVSVAAQRQASQEARATSEAEDPSAHVLVDEPRTVPMWPTSAWRPGAATGSPLAVLGASELVHEVTDVPEAKTSLRRFDPGPRALALAGVVVACLVVWVLKGPATPSVDVVSVPVEPVANAVATPVAGERRAQPAVLAIGTAAVAPAAVAAIAPPPVRVEPPAPSSGQPAEASTVAAETSAAAASPSASEPVAAPAVVIAPKLVAAPRTAPVVVARVGPPRRAVRNVPREREAPTVEARPAVAAPAPTAPRPRESPAIACTDKVQALGLCTLKP